MGDHRMNPLPTSWSPQDIRHQFMESFPFKMAAVMMSLAPPTHLLLNLLLGLDRLVVLSFKGFDAVLQGLHLLLLLAFSILQLLKILLTTVRGFLGLGELRGKQSALVFFLTTLLAHFCLSPPLPLPFLSPPSPHLGVDID